MMDSQAVVQGVGWDLTGEYPAADCAEIDDDLEAVDALLTEIERRNDVLTPLLDGAARLTVESAGAAIEDAREIAALIERARRLVRDPETYAECCLSVDSQDEQAQALLGRLQSINKRFDELAEPLGQFLDLTPETVVEAYLDDPAVDASRFSVEHSRRRRHELLPLAEENLVTSLGEDGIHAWGRLYDQLSGTLSCDVTVGNEQRTTGIAQAAGLMQKPDDRLRESAWRAINTAWDEHAESCAAAINAIAGWRLELCRKRSARAGTPVHYLDAPLHANRIQRATLDTVLKVAEEGIPLARRAALLQAKAYGKSPLRALGQPSARTPGRRRGRPSHRLRGSARPHCRRLRGSRTGDGRFRSHDGREQLDRRDGRPTQAARCVLHRFPEVAHAQGLYDLHRRR